MTTHDGKVHRRIRIGRNRLSVGETAVGWDAKVTHPYFCPAPPCPARTIVRYRLMILENRTWQATSNANRRTSRFLGSRRSQPQVVNGEPKDGRSFIMKATTCGRTEGTIVVAGRSDPHRVRRRAAMLSLRHISAHVDAHPCHLSLQ